MSLLVSSLRNKTVVGPLFFFQFFFPICAFRFAGGLVSSRRMRFGASGGKLVGRGTTEGWTRPTKLRCLADLLDFFGLARPPAPVGRRSPPPPPRMPPEVLCMRFDFCLSNHWPWFLQAVETQVTWPPVPHDPQTRLCPEGWPEACAPGATGGAGMRMSRCGHQS